MNVTPGPIPPFNNPPIQPQFYIPSELTISNVTLGRTTIVTTTDDTNFVIGNQARLLIPQKFGCVQLNNQTGYVISIPASNQVELSIDSSNGVNQFVAATSNQTPQIIPISDINQGSINYSNQSMTTYIPGSFRNISQ